MSQNAENIILNQSKRGFLETVALASTASFLPFCLASCDNADAFNGSEKVPFKIWQEV